MNKTYLNFWLLILFDGIWEAGALVRPELWPSPAFVFSPKTYPVAPPITTAAARRAKARLTGREPIKRLATQEKREASISVGTQAGGVNSAPNNTAQDPNLTWPGYLSTKAQNVSEGAVFFSTFIVIFMAPIHPAVFYPKMTGDFNRKKGRVLKYTYASSIRRSKSRSSAKVGSVVRIWSITFTACITVV